MGRFDVTQLPTGSYSISGSFSGSYVGDGSGLTGVGGDPFPLLLNQKMIY